MKRDGGRRGRALILGAYFAQRESRILHITREFEKSRDWDVEQRWVALGDRCPAGLTEFTVAVSSDFEPKFVMLNRQLAALDVRRYDYVLVCDDDILLPAGFLDGYLARVVRYDFALAQPARTHDSFTDHHFVSQLHGVDARETRFVEIGPLFSMRADAVPLLTPFDDESPMGWGYDFVWPLLIERAGLHMGIIDALPVAHDLRKPVSSYSRATSERQMIGFLSKRPCLHGLDAFRIIRSFA